MKETTKQQLVIWNVLWTTGSGKLLKQQYEQIKITTQTT